MSGYAKPLPPNDPANRPFWEGANRGVLVLQRCLDCGRHRFPAARYCVQCHGERSAWVATSGAGVVESHCTFHRAYWPAFEGDVPYEVVQVKLDEGVRLFSNLVGVPREQIRTGMRVRASFDPVTPAVTLVKFAPAE
ncbi:MAG TPA: OB-fold domain-containing protein [Burkholderiales bacterium]|nr:OB-fold domain-containing protein [Burkholderiales bacterium]